MPRRSSVPKYELHRSTGTARVQWTDPDGKRRCVSLGKYGSPESKRKYAEIVARVQQSAPPPDRPTRLPAGDGVSVSRLVCSFLTREAGGYSPSEQAHYRAALSLLVAACGDDPAAEFGTRRLAEVRDAMVGKGWTRQTVNAQVRRVRAVFRWGESLELVPAGKWFQLRSLPGLKKGKTVAGEQREIPPAVDADVEATLPHLTQTVAAMVQVQRLTGARPQDVCNMEPRLIDRTAEVWVYEARDHKRAHAGEERFVYIGPQAQAVLAPYLDGPADQPCFSPRRAWQEWNAARRAARRPKYPSWVKERQQGEVGTPVRVGCRYTTHAYGLAVERACQRAGVPKWTPNQLRHAAGESIRAQFGLDAAQEMLGHKHASTTERYAAPKREKAAAAAKKAG